MKRKFTNKERRRIYKVIKNSASMSLRSAALLEFVSAFHSVLLNPNPNIDLGSSALNIISNSLAFTAESVLLETCFKTPIYNTKEIIILNAKIITAAALLTHPLTTLVSNYKQQNRLSFDGFFPTLFQKISSNFGFSTASILAEKYLPPDYKIGGSFARFVAKNTISNIGGNIGFVIGSLPQTRVLRLSTLKSYAIQIAKEIPKTMFSSCLLSAAPIAYTFYISNV